MTAKTPGKAKKELDAIRDLIGQANTRLIHFKKTNSAGCLDDNIFTDNLISAHVDLLIALQKINRLKRLFL